MAQRLPGPRNSGQVGVRSKETSWGILEGDGRTEAIDQCKDTDMRGVTCMNIDRSDCGKTVPMCLYYSSCALEIGCYGKLWSNARASNYRIGKLIAEVKANRKNQAL
jgi:hypothetical protein